MSELGDLIKRLRGNRSLREASKLTGISHNYLSIVERGVDPRSGAPVSPTPETLKKIAESYNYSYDTLMRLAGYIEEENENKSPVEKLIEYLDLELTNEEIKERMNFRIDSIALTDEDVDEFIAFVRAKRAMKKQQMASVSRIEES